MAYEDLNMKNYIVGDCSINFDTATRVLINSTEYILVTPELVKALKLWEIVRIPKGKECNTCQLEKASDGHTWCPYFKGKYGVGELEYKNGKPIRHQQCLDMFGEE